MIDALADSLDDAAEFMAENLRPMRPGKRMRFLRHEDGAIGIFVQIRAADAAEFIVDEHLARAGLGGDRSRLRYADP